MVAQLLNHWFQPLEDDLGHAQAAFAGLLRAGDLEFANFTAFTTRGALFDTCTQLTQMDTETAAAIGFAGKSASTHAEQAYLPYRQLVRALAGQTRDRGGFADADFDDQAHPGPSAPLAPCTHHRTRRAVRYAARAGARRPCAVGACP